MKKPFLPLFLSLLLLLPAVPSLAGEADPTITTEETEPMGKGLAEFELNFESARGDESTEAEMEAQWTMGITSRLDFSMEFSHIFLDMKDGEADLQGGGDTTAYLKYFLHEGKGYVPSLALKAGAVLPTGDYEKEGLSDDFTGRFAGLYGILASIGKEEFRATANFGGTVAFADSLAPDTRGDRDDTLMASLALEYDPCRWSTLMAEGVWEKNIGSGAEPSEAGVGLGVKVSPLEGVTFDAEVRWGLSGEADVTYLAGITLEFGEEKDEKGKKDDKD